MARRLLPLALLLFGIILIGGCSPSAPTATPPVVTPPLNSPTPLGLLPESPTAQIIPPVTAVPQVTATPVPPNTSTPAPAPTVAPTQATQPTCFKSTFVSDVTVPDGTRLAVGQTFNKIWRVRNTGTCAWGEGFAFMFVRGATMTTTPVIAVPATAPGATADLLVSMTAPSIPGAYIGFWQMRNPNGALFGDTLWVRITVVSQAPAPAPSLTPIAAPTATSGCSGTPNIASFSISPSTINAGDSATLSWGFVSNADAAIIDNGIGGVATPGSTTVSPTNTTTYTLTANCGSTTQIAQVTLTVASAAATETPTSVPPTNTRTATPTRTPTRTRTPTATP